MIGRHKGRGRGPGRAAGRVAAAAIALGLVALVDATGMLAWADAALLRWDYRLRGTRTSGLGVVVVGIDEETVQAWGTPPYDPARIEALAGAVVAGKPRAIAWLEPEGRLSPTGPIATGDVPTLRRPATEPLVRVPLHGDVVRLKLSNEDGSDAFARGLLSLAGAADDTAEVRVNYLGWREAAPLLPASRVAAGEVPAKTFEDKVVLVGFTSSEIAPLVATPVGPMSPAEIVAEATLTALDGVEPRPVPRAILWVLMAVVALGLAIVLPRQTPARSAALLVATALVALLVEYVLFADLQLLLGASRLLVLVPIVGALGAVFEQRAISWQLTSVVPALRAKVSAGLTERLPEEEDEETFWRRCGERCARLAGAPVSVLAEQVRGRLVVRHVAGIDARALPVDALDVRAGALLEASRSLKATAAAGLAGPGDSLVVPIAPLSRVKAFWILGFGEAKASESQLELVEQLQQELARQLGQRELLGGLDGPEETSLLSAPGTVLAKVEELERVARAFERERRETEAVVEALPFGVATSTVAGELRYANPAIRSHFPTIADAVGSDGELAAWLASLTGKTVEACRDELRAIAAGRGARVFEPREGSGAIVQVAAQPARGTGGRRAAGLVVVSLTAEQASHSRVDSPERLVRTLDEAQDALTRVVSLPVPATAPTAPADDSGRARLAEVLVRLDEARRVLRPGGSDPERTIDVRELVLQALGECRKLACRGATTAVETRFADPLPTVRARPAALREALVALLHDALANADAKARVVVGLELANDRLRLTIDDGGATPASVARNLLLKQAKSTSHEPACAASALGAAAGKLAGSGAELAVEELEGGRARFALTLRTQHTPADVAAGARS